jgi:hypothetical protein
VQLRSYGRQGGTEALYVKGPKKAQEVEQLMAAGVV